VTFHLGLRDHRGIPGKSRNAGDTILEIQLAIPADLKTGDYAEFWADGSLKVFDRNGTLLSSVDVQGAPLKLQPGENHLALRAATAAPAKLTCITLGDALSW